VSVARPLLSVVVPVLDEEESLPELHARLTQAVAEAGGGEIVYVDDGSSDRSAEVVEAWTRESPDVVLVQLSRNFGMEVAMSAGLDFARGEWVVLIHADLQDPPELIPRMLERAGERNADVVYTRRIGRDESAVKRGLATAFYRLMERLARVPYQGQAGDFRLISRRVVEAIREMPERRRFLRGMVAWTGFVQVPIDYHRAGRAHGRSASYPALFRLAAEALVAYSDVPLSIATLMGLVTAALAGLAAVGVGALALLGAVSTTVTLFVLLAVLFVGGVQLISVGIIGRYLARVHEESLDRPLYLLGRVVPERPSPDGGPTDGAAAARQPRALRGPAARPG
jgi:glycosyltransferase involved in cell wall biosynthesis